MFNSITDFTNALNALPAPNQTAVDEARRRQRELTKPAGSLGRLEDCAITLAGWRNDAHPAIKSPATLIFAGNHGVTAQGVSPFPTEVTAQMVANFEAGGAAINAVSQSVGARLKVVAIDLEQPTADISTAPAMSQSELLEALNTGAKAIPENCDLLALGEMGIGNTTIAAALAASCFGGSGADWSGPGTGLDNDGINRKAAVVDAALERHRGAQLASDRLRCLGGRELAAIAGATIAARHARIPVLLDGYVTTAAIAPLFVDNPAIIGHCFAGHVSAEPAHRNLLQQMNMRPLLDLDMRLGEGTGATLAVAILKTAVATHNSMATFSEAAISNREQT